MIPATTLAGLTALLLSQPMPHNPNPWELIQDEDGVELWQRMVPGSDIYQIKIEMMLEGSSKQVWDVIRDVESVPEFNPYMAEARLLKTEGDLRWVYQRIDPPFVNDRDLTFRSRAMEDHETGVYQQFLEIDNQRGPPPIDGVVRIEVLQAFWTLEPVAKDRTRVLYWIHTDPGGWIPAWMVNYGQRRSVPDLIRIFQKRILDPKWRP